MTQQSRLIKRILAMTFVVIILARCTPFKKYADVPRTWAADIARLDSLNQMQKKSPQSILFVGSSSIRLWDDIEEDMSPYPVIRRGYGGASYVDVAYYIKELVYPHQFKALVLFAGNDIWGSDSDRSPKEIGRLLNHCIKNVRKRFANKPIFVIEITHVPKRSHLIFEIDAANQVLEKVCQRHEMVHFIPTKQIYLTPEGKIDGTLFRNDQIHQNEVGYKKWTEIIKEAIRKHLN